MRGLEQALKVKKKKKVPKLEQIKENTKKWQTRTTFSI